MNANSRKPESNKAKGKICGGDEQGKADNKQERVSIMASVRQPNLQRASADKLKEISVEKSITSRETLNERKSQKKRSERKRRDANSKKGKLMRSRRNRTCADVSIEQVSKAKSRYTSLSPAGPGGKSSPNVSGKKFLSPRRSSRDKRNERKSLKEKRTLEGSHHSKRDLATRSQTTRRTATNQWMRQILTSGVEGLIEEFAKVPQIMLVPEECGAQLNNKEKCRHPTDVWCIDASRVKLSSDSNNDFIHANFVDSVRERRFICTQGPLESTCGDFYKMIFDNSVEFILMFCRVNENGVEKTFQYFPLDTVGTLQFGEYTVRRVGEEQHHIDADVTERCLCVVKGTDAIVVRHIQWTDWPDHHAPENHEAILRFRHKVQETQKPIVVHCSAGVGRTGVFVLLEALFENLYKGLVTTSSELLSKLRKQRSSLIQSPIQYLFVQRVLLHYFNTKCYIKHDLKPKYEQFCQDYDRYYWVAFEAKTQKDDEVALVQETSL